MAIPLTLYIIFTLVVLFAPLRWAIPAYLLLTCTDFLGNRDSIGLLNAFRGFAVPVYLMWRLRAQTGHRSIILAPVAWGLLIVYAGIACFWSYFPVAAIKLVGHMTGSLIIGFVLARAAKGGYLNSRVAIPVTIGSISIAFAQFVYMHDWSNEESRFSAFTPAQAFAAFIAALYCMALAAPGLARRTRIWLCSALTLTMIFNGSRIWFCGIVLATLLGFIISSARSWAKIFTISFCVLTACFLIIMRAQLAQLIQDVAPSNRIVAAGLAAYEGDVQSEGLGTLRFRRIVYRGAIAQLENSTVTQFIFGRGTSNGALVTGSIFRGYAGMSDPNRMLHDEWLRSFYEWGLVGIFLWCSFWISIVTYAITGVRNDQWGYAKPLFIYVPALLVALAGENFIAGAGNAMSLGFLMLLGYATLAHRYAAKKIDPLLIAPEPHFHVNARDLIVHMPR